MMFKDRLRIARKSNGYTQESLATCIGVKKSTIAGYESGHSEPDMEKLVLIMKTLNVDANFLYQDEMSNNIGPAFSIDATNVANDYDSLSADGKELVRSVLDFAIKHFSSSDQ